MVRLFKNYWARVTPEDGGFSAEVQCQGFGAAVPIGRTEVVPDARQAVLQAAGIAARHDTAMLDMWPGRRVVTKP